MHQRVLVNLFVYGVFLSVSCANHNDNAVEILFFSANDLEIEANVLFGEKTTLAWDTVHAEQCEIKQEVGQQAAGFVPPSDTRVVYMTESTTLTLYCIGAGNSVSRSIILRSQNNGTNVYVAADAAPGGAGTLDNPFATLEEARVALNDLRLAMPIQKESRILLREGTYLLDKPFVLTARDAPQNLDYPLTIQSFPGETAILHGGKSLANAWQTYTANIWTLDVTDHLAQHGVFNTLLVDDVRAIRARTPNVGEYKQIAGINQATKSTAFDFYSGDMDPGWYHLTDVEVVSYRRWIQTRFRIDRIEGNTAYFAGSGTPLGREYDFDYDATTGRYYVENVREGLDSPGEWYLDQHSAILYYWPLDQRNPNTSKVSVPVLTQLVHVGRIPVPAEEDLTGNFTITHWVRTNSTATQMYSIGNASSWDGYRFGLNNGRIRFLIGAQVEGQETVCGTRDVADGQWHMISGVFNRQGLEFSCYIDGTFEASVPLVSAWYGMQTKLPNIGVTPCCRPFEGNLDELRVFYRSLEAAEIAAIYAAESQGVAMTSLDSVYLHASFENTDHPLGSDPRFRSLASGTPQAIEGVVGNAFSFNGIDGGVRILLRRPANIRFENLVFTGTDWELPVSGYPGGQAGWDILSPAAILLDLDHGAFINNVISSTGGGYAVQSRSSDLEFTNNEIFGNTGGGIHVENAVDDTDVANHIITDNRIHDNNAVFKEPTAVLVRLSHDNLIAHNLVYNTTYTGISVGWRWDTTATTSYNNRVSDNRIHTVMTELNDGGGIYLLGWQPGTVAERNVIYNIQPTDFHLHDRLLEGIYLDQGSREMTVRDNWVYRIHGDALLLHASYDNILTNNLFADGKTSELNFAGGQILDPVLGRLPSGNQFYQNLIFSSQDGLIFQPQTNPSLEISENNLYYSSQAADDPQSIFLKDLTQWRSSFGFDGNSVSADPLFVDYINDNFLLKAGSPALDLGFTPVDLTNAGPRN